MSEMPRRDQAVVAELLERLTVCPVETDSQDAGTVASPPVGRPDLVRVCSTVVFSSVLPHASAMIAHPRGRGGRIDRT